MIEVLALLLLYSDQICFRKVIVWFNFRDCGRVYVDMEVFLCKNSVKKYNASVFFFFFFFVLYLVRVVSER